MIVKMKDESIVMYCTTTARIQILVTFSTLANDFPSDANSFQLDYFFRHVPLDGINHDLWISC